jgi:rhamnose utilization protein RhaD (predicted bifunctional aldolase and dehydrogenase)
MERARHTFRHTQSVEVCFTDFNSNYTLQTGLTMSILDEIISLSRELGREDRRLAILGEGNTSCRIDDKTFLVKASGSSLSTMSTGDVTECRFEPLLALLDEPDADDEKILSVLHDSQVDPKARRASTEAVFHAYLLSLPGITWVGHTHPIAVNGFLCSPRAADFSNRRSCPDEIVCCGPTSLLLPYVDPGLALARAIRSGIEDYSRQTGKLPRLILLTNHGLIAPASGPGGVLAATRMAVKMAEVFSIAAVHGGPVFLEAADVERIENRSDEAYRRKQLGV